MGLRASLVLGWLAVACGPAVPLETSTTSTSGPDSSSTAVTGDGPTTGSPTPDLPAMCVEFRDDPPGPEVPLRLRNVGATDLFLHSDCDERRWLIVAEGPPSAHYPGGLFCSLRSCESALGEPCERFCNFPCSQLPVVRLVPGAVFEDTWERRMHTQIDMPLECGGCGSCSELRQAAPGTPLAVSVTVTTNVACDPGDPCTCEPGPDGTCEIAGVDAADVPETVMDFTFDGSPIDLELGA